VNSGTTALSAMTGTITVGMRTERIVERFDGRTISSIGMCRTKNTRLTSDMALAAAKLSAMPTHSHAGSDWKPLAEPQAAQQEEDRAERNACGDHGEARGIAALAIA
jgi:hypothetical protein